MNRSSLSGAASGAILLAITLTAAGGPAQAQDKDLIARGEYLTRMGDCAACHSTPGGQPFAGGVAIVTPFGSLYPPNITPDPQYGIGGWSDDDFQKTMHLGLSKDGSNLYPAMPYQWYTKVTPEDNKAIKAYLDTVTPVHAPSHPDDMAFPFNQRLGLKAYNIAYFHEGVFQPDKAKSDEFNRGAYLVQGLGHCGACHTPKGIAMEPITSKAYSGGMIDNWYAPNITSNKETGIGGWSDEDLAQFLKSGTAPGKGVVLGPMAQVVHDSLAYISDSDIHAIVTFLKGTVPIHSYQGAQPPGNTGPQAVGAVSYLNHCASCHQQNGDGLGNAVPALNNNGAVLAKGPENVIRVILGGRIAAGTYAPMPALGDGMTPQEIVDAVNYVRTAWSNAAPATATEGMVGKIRGETFSMYQGQRSPEGKGDPCASEEVLRVPPLKDPDQAIAHVLSGMNAATLQEGAVKAVALARKADPNAAQADLVNGLAVAYCKALTAQPAGLGTVQNRDLLNRFAQLAYTQYVDPERN